MGVGDLFVVRDAREMGVREKDVTPRRVDDRGSL